MKYIVFNLDGKDSIFTFPRNVDHDRMSEACQAIRFGGERAWDRKLRGGEVVSAGFITNGTCYGHSETLGIKSRGATDTKLLTADGVGDAEARKRAQE